MKQTSYHAIGFLLAAVLGCSVNFAQNVTTASVTTNGQTRTVDITHQVTLPTPATPPPTVYTIQALPLPAGMMYPYVTGINNSSQVLAVGFTPAGNSISALWTNLQPTILPNLGGTGGTCAVALNNNGVVTGDSWVPKSSGYPFSEIDHAFVWSPAQGIVDLQVGYSFADNQGVGIGDAGQIIGNDIIIGSIGLTGWFLWTPNGTTGAGNYVSLPLLSGLSGYPQGKVYGISPAGVMVGSLNGYQPVIYAGGILTLIASGNPVAVNDKRQVIGQDTNRNPAYWDSAGIIHSLDVPDGVFSSYAYAINNSGAAVGQGYTLFDDLALYWPSLTSPAIDLNALLSDADAAKWTLTEADAINGWGQIAGIGMYNGQSTPFVMTPVPQMAVDMNRDGEIHFDSENPDATKSDSTTVDQPFHFWSNDDDDDGDIANQSAFTGNSDEPGKLSGFWELDGRTPDHAHAGVDGRCDLIDFFPVCLDIKQLLVVLPTTTVGIEYKLKQADEALNFVYTDLTHDHAFDYLTKEDAVYGTGMNKLPHLAETTAITAEGVTLSIAFLDKIKNGTGKGVILVEGTKASDKPLVLEVFKDGQSIAQIQVYIKISEVEKMYRWINLRGVAGQSETRPTNTSEPENYPDNRTNGKMFIFVHGYNVNEQQSRGWQAEAFKRMYQAGSRAMFTAVTWHGDHSQISLIGVSPDYWENITNAFQTAAALPAAVNALPGPSKIIVGHSMGNVVVSSAIKDQSPALNVANYFMLNAAVALEAYDTSTLHIADMRHPDWSNYNQRLWATQWYDLFPQGDRRRGLTWLNRFGDVSNGINFYSSGEEVLNNNDAASGGTPGQIPAVGGERAWVLQEMVKGTSHIGAVLTFDSQGGWGFNGTWDIAETTNTDGGHAGPITTYRHRTPVEANALTDDQLKTEPFFRHFQDSRLTTAGGSTAASEYLNRAQILGGAIPALSFPAGRNPIPLFNQQDRNTDLMTEEDGWPQERLDNDRLKNRWLHSDAKNIAYRYNYKLWQDWVDRGDLR